MYFLETESPTPPRPDFIELPGGLRRPSDEVYLRAGRRPPSPMEMHLAASIRVSCDRKLRRKTPSWIKAWAEDPRFKNR